MTPPLSKLAGKKVLVVDDEELLREIVCCELEYVGAKVVSAESGSRAIQILRNEKCDALVSDIRMPDGDGVQLLLNIKNEIHPKPIVVLLSGFSDLSNDEYFAMGADAVFSKPCDIDMLLSEIVKRLD